MNNTTTELQWGDVIFKPGQRVRTTDASDYAGLDGVILEIHTGEDKETDNLTPDIIFTVALIFLSLKQTFGN